MIHPKSTLSRPATYNRDISFDPRKTKKSYSNERDQYLDWEAFKQTNASMLNAHEILINKILSSITPTNFDDLRFILRVDYLVDNNTINKLIAFLLNSRFVEFEKADKDEWGQSVNPIVYLHPRRTAPSAPYSLWIPQKR